MLLIYGQKIDKCQKDNCCLACHLINYNAQLCPMCVCVCSNSSWCNRHTRYADWVRTWTRNSETHHLSVLVYKLFCGACPLCTVYCAVVLYFTVHFTSDIKWMDWLKPFAFFFSSSLAQDTCDLCWMLVATTFTDTMVLANSGQASTCRSIKSNGAFEPVIRLLTTVIVYCVLPQHQISYYFISQWMLNAHVTFME